MKGFFNQILSVDLTRKTFETQSVDDKIYRAYLGGKGLGTKLLVDRNPAGVDPLSEDNHIIFATGPVTNTMTWGSSRYGVFTKSPLTGLYAESYSGGRVPEAISATGFDAVVIRGRAEKLTLLEINPDRVVFHEAEHLAGKDTFETESAVQGMLPSKKYGNWKTGSTVVGPAAEACVACAIIKNDGWRCAGRAGTGAVLGSKNVKAVFFAGSISTLVRAFNLREGMTPEDETLPKAFHTPLEDNGAVITAQQAGMLMDDYRDLRGWDQ